MPTNPSATNDAVGPGGAGGFAGVIAAQPGVTQPSMDENSYRQAKCEVRFFCKDRELTEVGAVLPASSDAPVIETTFGKKIAQGKYGCVYELDIDSVSFESADYVVKVGQINRKEATLFAEVTQSRVWFGRLEHQPDVMVCKKMPGVTLCSWLDNHKEKKGDAVVKWQVIRAVFSALDEKLHSRGFVHGDLHDENILVVVEAGNIEVNFIDFGRSSRVGEPTFNLGLDVDGLLWALINLCSLSELSGLYGRDIHTVLEKLDELILQAVRKPHTEVGRCHEVAKQASSPSQLRHTSFFCCVLDNDTGSNVGRVLSSSPRLFERELGPQQETHQPAESLKTASGVAKESSKSLGV